MDFKLSNDILAEMDAFVDGFNKERISAVIGNAPSHWGCNGCSGDCNMTAKGGCGKYG